MVGSDALVEVDMALGITLKMCVDDMSPRVYPELYLEEDDKVQEREALSEKE